MVSCGNGAGMCGSHDHTTTDVMLEEEKGGRGREGSKPFPST
jgi:hypothetical protein